ncbi:MAG: TonB-dependent receptor plug domain-containing protein [Novosphingobium sp.]
MAKHHSVDTPFATAARRKPFLAIATGLFCCTALTTPAFADDAAEEPSGEIVVTGSLNALPVSDVGSVFGFEKTLVETPRSASTISSEQMERFGITDIYDLVAQAPGTFTNSFFGVGGALDIRGTPGEVYFRGMRRLDNPGNYPTPIGASDRIDIVRGPASPIYGPAKTGGYMNFVPKSARVKGGALLSKPEGEVSYVGGSWSKSDLSANIRGPLQLGSQAIGYSLYAEIEDSGSYYRNMSTKQTILQASFDTDLGSNVRMEFGGMYQNFRGQQNGGWNRLTQDLVDNGTYITGAAQPLDTNGDGQISPEEINAKGGTAAFSPFRPSASMFTNADFIGTVLPLVNPGTAKLSRRDVLAGKNDKLNNKATTLYWDTTFTSDGGLEIKNQLFYDGYKNFNENSYGFSQFHNSWVIEDKITISKSYETEAGKFSFQLSPSIRHTHFKHGDDFNYEYFHRVDLTQGYTPASDRLLSTECDCDYSNYLSGYYNDFGFAGLADLDFNFGLDLTLGARYDSIHAKSTNDPSKLRVAPAQVSASDTDGGWSWTASASYKLPLGLIPYVTASQQSTVVAGQGAEISTGNLAAGTWISASRLYEGGLKGSFLDDRLYAAVSVYKQKRTDYSVQSSTVNQAVETKGLEAEMRWSVDSHLLLTAAYTRTKVYNLTFLNAGRTFSFFGIDDLVNVTDPSLILGGQPGGFVPIPDKEASRRQGIPTNLYSATATYAFDNGIALSGSIVQVDSVYSGQSRAVKLPSYTLVDLGLSYSTGPWLFRAVVKNATDAKYFRANFTELFGSTIALPERPRSFQGTISYKF